MSLSLFKNKIGVSFFIGVLFILGGAGQASALNFTYYFPDPRTGQLNAGNFWETCSGYLTTDTSYPIGSTVIANGELKSTNIEFISSCGIYSTDDPIFLDAQVLIMTKSSYVRLSASDTLAILGMNTVGPHNLGFVVYSGSTGGSGTFNLPITVTAVATPVVDVFLGSLNEMKSFASNFVGNVTSYFSAPVYAQNKVATTTDKTGVKTPTAVGVILADVNIVDVIATSTNGVFSGRFSIQGKLGQQNDVHYGLMVLDDKDTILDAKELGVISKINQGETNRYTLKYSLPTYISGSVRVLLVAETAKGLTLSHNQIFKGDITGEKSNFPCVYIAGTKASKVSKIECLSSKDTSLTVSYGKNSIFATSNLTETINLKSGKKVVLSPNVAPGEYFATIVTKAGDKRILPLTKDGVYGNISSIVVHTGDKANVVKVAVFADVSTSSVAIVNLVGANSEECGKGEAELKGVAVEFSIETKCKTGTVTVALKDKQGQVLGLASEPFSVLTFVKAGEKGKGNTSNTLALVSLVGLIGVVGLFNYFRKRDGVEGNKGGDTGVKA
ncbi:TPA: hypothetical protein DEP94_03570 [Candidatus Nomurabacteria bacterium]|nr:hypothetical protein [Candidatus Nomurabacteria bacterium]